MIALTQVDIKRSSQVAAYGFEPVQKVLRVQYRNGRLYDYKEFGADDHAKLEAAESLGKHLNAHVKPHFACEPAPTDEPDEDDPITTTDGAVVDTRKPWVVPGAAVEA